MAEEDAFENLDGLDWSDVESELKANRDQILSEVKTENNDQKEKKEGDHEAEDHRRAGNPTSRSISPETKKRYEKKLINYQNPISAIDYNSMYTSLGASPSAWALTSQRRVPLRSLWSS